MRIASEKRKTSETDIEVEVNLDGRGEAQINTGIGFFDHMLATLSRYSLVDIKISGKGDLKTGTHHTIEDTGIVLGIALARALGDKKGICRSGCFTYVMDDVLVEAVVDISGRSRLIFENRDGQPLEYSTESIQGQGGFQCEEVKEFFWALAENMRANISLRLISPGNSHHEIEATFKAFGKALRMAIEKDPRVPDSIPSTKGVI